MRSNIHEFLDDDVQVEGDDDEERHVDAEKDKEIRTKYGQRTGHFEHFINRDAKEIAQQFVKRDRQERDIRRTVTHQVPTLKDPKLFAIRCLIGAEREMALSVGNKFRALKGTDEEIRIISVSALDKIQGYIYVEAINKYDAETACQGFNKLRTQYINVGPCNGRWSTRKRSTKCSSPTRGTAKKSTRTTSCG